MKINKIILLIFSIGICLLAGVIGSIFTVSSIPTWYITLRKPPFSPPNWVFGPVWTALYIMMGISLYLVLNSKIKSKEKRKGLSYFFIQLVLNALWSIVFFGLHLPFYAFVIILFLWLTILLTAINFMKVSKTAGWLLFPYLLWVSFATLLNFSITILNPR